MHLHADGLIQRRAGVADALEASVSDGGRLPAEQAGDVQVIVLGIEPPAARAGKEAATNGHRAAIGAVAEDVHHRAAAVREMDKLAAEGAPLVFGHPHLTAGRIIQNARDPH